MADDGETRSRHTLESILEHKWSVSAYDRIDIVITATGSKVKQPTLSDAIWQVVYNRPLPTGRWKSSGILEVRFDAELFLGFGALTPDTHLVSIMDTIVRTQAPYYGYIEIASFDEVQGGTYYGNTPHWPVSFHRAINHVEWLSLGETRRDRVRDLFWAQYLNVDAATRLGSTFGRQYTELKWQGESAGQIVKPYPNGDLFFSVSRTPFDFVISSPDGWLSPEILNAVWLRRELRRAGLL